MRNGFRSLAQRVSASLQRPPDEMEKSLVAQGHLLAQANRSRMKIGSLEDVEWGVFSQWGEDGIVDWLVQRLPAITPVFIEFGVQNYRESNTRMLLHLRNWRGLVIDGSEPNIADIRAQDISWRYDLTAVAGFITRDNINQLISGAGVSGEIGLLSVDIDGNDYWVWDAIDVVSPAIVVCEYNAVFGDLHQLSVPYDPMFVRGNAHHSNLFFGASLPALVALGSRKGYAFIGTNTNGCNAFFVRQDLEKKLREGLENVKSYPSRFREARSREGDLTLTRSTNRVNAISSMLVHDFGTDSDRTLSVIGDLYSPDWQY